MKFQKQVEALKAIAITSDFGKRAVSSDDMATMLSLAPNTARLNNAFFADSGLVTKEGRGRYKPTSVTNEFARSHSFNAAQAGQTLAPVLAESWYYIAIKQRLAMSPATREQVIEALAHAADATKERQGQLSGLLDWLQYAGLIDASGAHVTLTDAAPDTAIGDGAGGSEDLEAATAPDEKTSNKTAESRRQTPGDTATTGTTTSQRRSVRRDAEAALSLSFDFALTSDELSKLAPEQITALFQAVGAVIAIKSSVT